MMVLVAYDVNVETPKGLCGSAARPSSALIMANEYKTRSSNALSIRPGGVVSKQSWKQKSTPSRTACATISWGATGSGAKDVGAKPTYDPEGRPIAGDTGSANPKWRAKAREVRWSSEQIKK